MAFAAMVALSAGILETVRKWRLDNHLEAPSLFWQLPQYLLMGIAEVFGVISGKVASLSVVQVIGSG
jgi:hypothetical protein